MKRKQAQQQDERRKKTHFEMIEGQFSDEPIDLSSDSKHSRQCLMVEKESDIKTDDYSLDAVASALSTAPKRNTSQWEKSFNELPPSYTFAMNKTFYMRDNEEQNQYTFWFEDLFQPPTADPPVVLSNYLKRVFLSTYNVNLDWLFSMKEPHRRLTYAEKIVLVHGMKSLQSNLKQLAALNPDSYLSSLVQTKKLLLHFPELRLPYGTQHGKLYLIYFENSLRVVVTTANLTKDDWKQKLQGTWVQEFPKKKQKIAANDFEQTLVDYLRKLQMFEEAYLVKEFDFSSASVILVTSCPGYFSKTQLNKYGHMKIRKELSQLQYSGNYSPPHCLFSSLGTINEAYITEEIKTSFSIPQKKKTLKSRDEDSRVAIIWPTVKEVNESNLGIQGADHYCAERKKFKPFILKSLYKWIPVRERHLSHTKLYTQVKIEVEKGNLMSLPWVFLTSANLSKAAHGQLVHEGKTLMVRSFEIGVLFIPRDNQLFVPASLLQRSLTEESADTEQKTIIKFPIPYKLPLVPYDIQVDKPWCDEEFR